MALESMLEVIEYRKLVAGHNIGCRLCFDFGPDSCQGSLEDVDDGGVPSSFLTVPCNLQRLRNRGATMSGVSVVATHTAEG